VSPTIALVTEIVSLLAFLLNGAMLFLVLSRGRQRYHYLFAAVLACFAVGCLSIFLVFIRISHTGEFLIYVAIIMATSLLSAPCIYHFTCSYLEQPRKKSTVFIWAYTAIIATVMSLGMALQFGAGKLTHTEAGVSVAFQGGIIYRVSHFIVFFISLVFIWLACWFLFRARRRETSTLARRHMQYILVSFLVISLILLAFFLFPTRIVGSGWLIPVIHSLATAALGALVGMAIIKERLFDITVIIKKTTIYSILLALVIFIFSLSEHLLATYVGQAFGEHSIFIHIISIAVVIAVLMPVRQKVERGIERFFAQKKVEF
jgi:hypothetical protein